MSSNVIFSDKIHIVTSLLFTMVCIASMVLLIYNKNTIPSEAWCHYELKSPKDYENYVPREIAFGSCLNSNIDASILGTIANQQNNYELFIFLGDNMYPDYDNSYKDLSCNSYFKYMTMKIMHVMAIWDDHDYGYDDAGIENPDKEAIRSEFLDFWKITSDSERRNHEGIYHVNRFRDGNYSLNVILLDLRYFREQPQLSESCHIPLGGKYCPNRIISILGDEQALWLKGIIENEDVDLIIIASSSQMLRNNSGHDSWSLYPTDLDMMMDLMHGKNVVILSGDVHWGEISKSNNTIDITSSGLTRFDDYSAPNKYRIGPDVIGKNFGSLSINWESKILNAAIRSSTGEILTELKYDFNIAYFSHTPL